MAAPLSLDNIDRQILKLLVADARIPYTEIARRCNLASSSIHFRIKKMKDRGILNEMRVMISPELLHLEVCAYVHIKIIQPNMLDSVIAALKNIQEVVECHCIMGEFTLLSKIYCKSNTHLMDLVINKIHKIPGIADTSSHISLKKLIDHPLPVFTEDDE